MPLIYCVEDDASIRELIGYALESQNFAVKTMADSHEFWKVKNQIWSSWILCCLVKAVWTS